MKQASPYGSWPSPVSAEQIAGATTRLDQTAVRGAELFWTEGRPSEQGRYVLVRADADGRTSDLTPAPFSVRTRAHEYGGGAFALLDDGGIVFSDDADQQLHRLRSGAAAPERLTDAAQRRFADAVHDARRRRLIAVCEDHRHGDIDAVNTLVAIDLDGVHAGRITELVGGHDFFSTPCLSPDGRQLAWLSWDHPDMPWDATTLWLADVSDDGKLGTPRPIAGGASESVFQPSWSPGGELHFVSDRSGWWNLYRLHGGGVEPLHPMQAEFGEAQWVFGMSTYGFDEHGRIVCIVAQGGRQSLARLDPQHRTFESIATPFCTISELRVGAGFAAMIAASETMPSAMVRLDLASGAWRVLRSVSEMVPDPASTSVAEPIEFATEGGDVAHAFYYRPTHAQYVGRPGEKPPLIVFSHGGPSGTTDAGFRWTLQYWTSRGFAIVDVNYRGSTGYGRAYREKLNGQWGIADVADAIAAARHLVARGDVDPKRLAIRGGSAGGYTTLCALTFHRFFHAGASHYGIGDLEALAKDTHKFESRYLDRLVGPYPQARDVYLARSPVQHIDRLASPMILLQGREDKAVPPAQAEAMFEAVRAKGLPVALLMFDGEQHGFRRAATIRRALEAELYFYGRVFGFQPADTIEPVPIDNLDAA